MSHTAPTLPRLRARTVALACALALAPAAVAGQDDAPLDGFEDPPLDEFTAMVFEVVDIGFCQFPDIPDDAMRDALADISGHTPLRGTATAPIDAPLYGDGYFTRGDGGAALAASMIAWIIPDAGEITQLCLVLLPADSPQGLEGSFDILGPLAFDEDAAEPDPAYMLFGQHVARGDDRGTVQLADLTAGAGAVAFFGDGGEVLEAEITFDGALGDDIPLSVAFEIDLMNEDALTFMYMHTPQ